MTSKERQILKEAVRKTILSHIDKPIKLKELVTENFQNWEIGRVMTLKDNPPFKTPKQIEEELNEAKETKVRRLIRKMVREILIRRK